MKTGYKFVICVGLALSFFAHDVRACELNENDRRELNFYNNQCIQPLSHVKLLELKSRIKRYRTLPGQQNTYSRLFAAIAILVGPDDIGELKETLEVRALEAHNPVCLKIKNTEELNKLRSYIRFYRRLTNNINAFMQLDTIINQILFEENRIPKHFWCRAAANPDFAVSFGHDNNDNENIFAIQRGLKPITWADEVDRNLLNAASKRLLENQVIKYLRLPQRNVDNLIYYRDETYRDALLFAKYLIDWQVAYRRNHKGMNDYLVGTLLGYSEDDIQYAYMLNHFHEWRVHCPGTLNPWVQALLYCPRAVWGGALNGEFDEFVRYDTAWKIEYNQDVADCQAWLAKNQWYSNDELQNFLDQASIAKEYYIGQK